jgi:hypothetical protein
MDLIVRLFLRLGVLLEMPAPRQELQPIPIPVRSQPPHIPGAPR